MDSWHKEDNLPVTQGLDSALHLYLAEGSPPYTDDKIVQFPFWESQFLSHR